MLKRFRLSLRELFWLQILAAIGICWFWEWKLLSVEYRKCTKWALLLESYANPSGSSLGRMAALEELRQLDDNELSQHLLHIGFDDNIVYGNKLYDCVLTECARRCMVRELQSHIDKSRAEATTEFHVDLKFLTALRRAQGRPDPLKVKLKFDLKADEKDTRPSLIANVENVDELGESFHYFAGGDDRSGRQGRFRVRLLDLNGRVVEDSNFRSFGMGGGIGRSGELKPGDDPFWNYGIDLRSYVKPPPSGLYTLQLIHGTGHIVEDPNLEGLIVWTSDPIKVQVENRVPSNLPIAPVPLLVIGFVMGLVLVRKRVHVRDKTTFRDLLYLGLVLSFILVWFGHSFYLRSEISKNQPDAEADWSIRVVE